MAATAQESTAFVPEATESAPATQVAHGLLHFALAVRYRKNVVLASLAAAALLGGLYYATATRYYAAKAAILVTQVGPDQLNTSMTGEESQRRNTMPTFENMIRSAKVLERALESFGPEDRVDLEGVPAERWIETIQGKLSARTIRATSILEVAYRSRDPHVAVHVVNAVVQSYLEFMREMHEGTTSELLEQLTKQRSAVAEEHRRVQQRLFEARQQLNDIKFDSEAKTLHPLLERCVLFNNALVELQKQRAELEASWRVIDTALGNGEDIGQHLMSMGDEVGKEILMGILGIGPRDSTAQANLEQRLMEDRSLLRRVQDDLGPNHPELLTLQERIRMTEQFLAGYEERIHQRLSELRKGRLGPWLLQMVRQRLDEARAKETQLLARYEEARAQAVELSGQLLQIQTLERDERRLGDESDELFKKITAVDLKKDGSEVRTAVIQQPKPSLRPVSPRLSYVGILVLLGGLGAGVGLVHLLDALDDRFRSIEEMQQRLGVSVLAMVHQFKGSDTTGLTGLAMCAASTSVESEAFRTLRTALDLAHPDARQIVVSSGEPGDGKTTVLANLAVACAQANKKTLLVDADLRRPGLTKMMHMRSTRGLSEILRADGEIADLAADHIRNSGLPGLDILPSGPRPANPAELLAGTRFSQLLAWAATLYDQILIDSPPALATSDTAIIGRLVDGVVLVVRPAKNRRRLVMRAVESLSMLKIPLLGLVINRVGSAQDRGYYSYHTGYGYDYGYAAACEGEFEFAPSDGTEDESTGGQAITHNVPKNPPPKEKPQARAPAIRRRAA